MPEVKYQKNGEEILNKIDGYMHKDKKCCQKVANAAGGKVIRINPKDKVGENSIGQEISYKDVYRYCPLCSYDF